MIPHRNYSSVAPCCKIGLLDWLVSMDYRVKHLNYRKYLSMNGSLVMAFTSGLYGDIVTTLCFLRNFIAEN